MCLKYMRDSSVAVALLVLFLELVAFDQRVEGYFRMKDGTPTSHSVG